MQIYAEAESRANEFIQIAMPRRNSICGEAKYTQKPRVMKTNLFDFHYRGATVFLPQANYAEAKNLVLGESATDSRKNGALSLIRLDHAIAC